MLGRSEVGNFSKSAMAPECTKYNTPLEDHHQPKKSAKRFRFLLIAQFDDGYPWISMDIHGMDIHGSPWMSMDVHGNPLISMDIK